MNRIIQLAFHPTRGAKYFSRKVKIKARKTAYLFHKACNMNCHDLRLASALKDANVKNESELYERWKEESGNAFLHSNAGTIIETIKRDSSLLNRIISQADKVLDNDFYVLYDFISGRQDSDGHYLWFNDYKSNYNYNISFYAESREKNRTAGVDYKRVWEIARMQYLLAPALAYRLTNDEKYSEKVKNVLNDFSLSNPLYIGPNWNPSMEIGIRAANIVLSLELIHDSKCIDASFVHEMVGLLSDHAKAILGNEENLSKRTSNHYLGGLLGLAAVSSFLPFLKNSKRISKYAYSSIVGEINKQIFESGGDYEGSTSYHRLVGELICFTIIACQKNKRSFSQETLSKLHKMAEFIYNIAGENCDVFQIGDNDSGRVFQLLPENPNNHSFVVNLISALAKNCIRYPDGQEILEIFTGKNLPLRPFPPRTSEWIAEDFGIGRISSGCIDLIISCVNVQKNGMGGHTHNDCGSFCLRCNDFPVIVDPGTGVYTGDATVRNTLRSIDSHSSIKIDESEPRNITNNLFGWNDNYGMVDFKIENQTANVLIKKDDIEIRRSFTLKEHSVTINDTVTGNTRTISTKLILAPETTVEFFNKNKCFIHGPYGTIIIQGSWDMSETNNLYSSHYDSISKTKALLLVSSNGNNTLSIMHHRADN